MKFNLLTLLGIAVLMNQTVLGYHYGFNPFRNDGGFDGSGDFDGIFYNYDPRYTRQACDYSDFTYRGYNTYNFNNCVPLHYGLFSEDEVQDFIQNSIQYYRDNQETTDPEDLEAGADYRADFEDQNPLTYQDWYGLSSYYPRAYNSYRRF